MAFSSNDCQAAFEDISDCNGDDKCNKRQGDCDDDDDCVSGLFCRNWSDDHSFEEDAPPHGCSGAPIAGDTDYCVRK